MRALIAAALLAAASSSAAAQQLTFTTRIELRTAPRQPPSNPLVASIIERVSADVVQSFARELGGAEEFTTVVGPAGLTIEYAKGGPAQTAGHVELYRASGERFVLDAPSRSYWRVPGPAPSSTSPSADLPSATLTRTGQFDRIAGVRAERVTFVLHLRPSVASAPAREANQAARVILSQLTMTGEAWIAPQYRSYAALLARSYAASPAAIRAPLQALQDEGFVMRVVLGGDLMNGRVLERDVTSMTEGAIAAARFRVPAAYRLVEAPPPVAPASSAPKPPDPPKLVSRVSAAYTTEAAAAKIEGTVRLRATVRQDGTVGDVQVIQSLDTRFGLDRQAIAAVRQWRFKPAELNGKPVEATTTISVNFKLQ